MAVLDLRPFQNEVSENAKVKGHSVGEWQIVEGEQGKDYHLSCNNCNAMFSVRLMVMTQKPAGMTVTMYALAIGVSDMGAQPCAKPGGVMAPGIH